ncbi:gamma-glutamylcyclotransferase family protein [Mangrovibacter yixingensis]|uniref:gamma-glutamylcyclotransferase family protein n=1 Tax=Mangrovibacter yixingensis TaxID=1529639 RepID=UPI001CFDA65C|nr:gamma-glutamylcyclotransferase family protein [Mangrovibacter yixingensis]
MAHLFVYGSLCPGEENAGLLMGMEGKWEPAQVKGHVVNSGWRTLGGYPALVLDSQGGIVDGYLFTSQKLDEHWAMLDDFEGADYLRVTVDVTTQQGQKMSAFVYSLKA